MSDEVATRNVWSARKGVISVAGRLLPFNDECGLFTDNKGRWWLSYDKDNNTGGFKSMKAAKAWYAEGGR